MKKYKKKIIFYKLLKVLTLLLIILTLFFIFLRVFINLTISNVITNSKYEITEPISFLLIGSDYRSEESNIDGARADTIIVVTLNPSNARGNMEFEIVSIPRDNVVNIPCAPYENTYDKINSSFNYGLGEGDGSSEKDLDNAITCTQQTVEDLLNIDIDYYVMATFEAVIDIVDAIGGIDINSIADICVEDKEGNGFSESGECLEDSLFISEGYQLLDGEHALGYARSRYGTSNSDYERNMRQQQVIVAIAKKILSDPLKYGSDFVNVFKEDCQTNIEINDIWTYINFASSLYNNIALNLANDIPVYLDKKTSIYQNQTTTQITNDGTSVTPVEISEIYGQDNVDDFEKYSYVSRTILTKEYAKAPSNLNKELSVVDENNNNNNLNPITIEYSTYSTYSTAFISNGWYSYIDQDTLYYTSNLLRKSLNNKVEDTTYDYDMLASSYYITTYRNPLYAEYEGITQENPTNYDDYYNYYNGSEDGNTGYVDGNTGYVDGNTGYVDDGTGTGIVDDGTGTGIVDDGTGTGIVDDGTGTGIVDDSTGYVDDGTGVVNDGTDTIDSWGSDETGDINIGEW